eukprot:TRINITY_DN13539_c0_g4_i1.p1 TRINITY_DN13539_c0_g4~~TRINITY_DN13539_c0_g4_i1.p1  ORF type:complete len:130 (-),score=3.70 TRINITY_DN13539_c0_g4_i1:398-787(-)
MNKRASKNLSILAASKCSTRSRLPKGANNAFGKSLVFERPDALTTIDLPTIGIPCCKVAPGAYNLPGSIGNPEVHSRLSNSPKFTFGKQRNTKLHISNLLDVVWNYGKSRSIWGWIRREWECIIPSIAW